MFFLFVAVSLFLTIFTADKMQLWMKAVSGDAPRAPMVWGPLGKLAWKFAGRDEGRFMFFEFLFLVLHIVAIGAAFDYIKIGRGAGSGIIPAIIVSLALAVFWGSFYLRRRKV